jgi:hypothetical protein
MQSVISLWYFTDGRKLPAAQAARRRFGEWDTEWSLAHMLRILRTTILEATINPESATKANLYQLLDQQFPAIKKARENGGYCRGAFVNPAGGQTIST